jgi:hypothetical protein
LQYALAVLIVLSQNSCFFENKKEIRFLKHTDMLFF